MDKEYTQAILSAIKTDDSQRFARLVEERKGLLSLCFGRLPLLSLIYLYRSRRIASLYERTLSAINSYSFADEDIEAYRLFSSTARRVLRLYVFVKTIVSPLEMLAIIGDSEHLHRVFAKYEKDEKIEKNIAHIYKILHNQSVSLNNGNIILRRLALPRIARAAAVALASLACLIVILSGALWGTAGLLFGSGEHSNPVKIISESQLVAALGSQFAYVLERDITLTEPWQCKDYAGTLYGNGHTVFVKENVGEGFIGTLTGSIENLNFVFEDTSLTLTDDMPFLVNINNGSINNVTVSLNAELTISGESETLFISGICQENNGEIKYCFLDGTVNVVGNGVTDAYFCAIAANNNGLISDCFTTEDSHFVVDSTDIAGIAIENNTLGIIKNCTNNAEIEQRTEHLWYPLSAGIVLRNSGTVSECFNYGTISSEATFSSEEDRETYIAGIVAVNNKLVENCINNGDILLETASSLPYAGGVVCINNADIIKCKNESKITVMTQAYLLYAGGVASVNSHYAAVIDNCCAYGLIEATVPDTGNVFAFVGGMVGYLFGTVKDSYSAAEFDCSGENAYAGGVIGVALYNQAATENNYYVDRSNVEFGVGSILVINLDNSRVVYNGVDENTERLLMGDLPELEVYWG